MHTATIGNQCVVVAFTDENSSNLIVLLLKIARLLPLLFKLLLGFCHLFLLLGDPSLNLDVSALMCPRRDFLGIELFIEPFLLTFLSLCDQLDSCPLHVGEIIRFKVGRLKFLGSHELPERVSTED